MFSPFLNQRCDGIDTRTDPPHAHPSPAATRWLAALSLGVIFEYVIFFCFTFARSGPRDGDQFLVFHTLQFWNASMFGMAKQWTPLMCAGLSMAGEPQVPFMSLSMAVSYLFGPLIGVKSAVIVYVILGWVGAYAYAGLWLRIPHQQFLAAALYIGNGFFFCRLGFGHFDFVPFLTLPLLLWAIHISHEWSSLPTRSVPLRAAFLSLMMGALMALAVDGSPVAIIHLMFWVTLYVAVFSILVRSIIPAAVFMGAIALTALLDAGYLWPMLQSQAAFPRLTPDRFTSFLSLIYFIVLPIRGKLLPANGNGHELSVFIGPVLVYCLYHQRRWLTASMPVRMGRPLLVVSVVSIVLGMGSMKALHVPTWLSPFDMLRPLPGFRSIGVTGRYWGFLALPLSLMSAMALWRFSSNGFRGWRLHGFFALVLIFQLGFQGETLTKLWLHSPDYKLAPRGEDFLHGPENVQYVALPGETMQGQLLTPTRGISDCYDMDDFVRTGDGPGSNLVLSSTLNGTPLNNALSVRARFANWSKVQVAVRCIDSDSNTCHAGSSDRIQMEFRQAYHRGWHADGCNVSSSHNGHLLLDCPASGIDTGRTLIFNDPTSAAAATVSLVAWVIWLFALAGTIHVALALRMRRSGPIRARVVIASARTN